MLTARLFHELTPKLFDLPDGRTGTHTGESLLVFLESLLSSLRSGTPWVVEDAWSILATNVCTRVLQQTKDKYHAMMEQRLGDVPLRADCIRAHTQPSPADAASAAAASAVASSSFDDGIACVRHLLQADCPSSDSVEAAHVEVVEEVIGNFKAAVRDQFVSATAIVITAEKELQVAMHTQVIEWGMCR
jgi:hypothetical protein